MTPEDRFNQKYLDQLQQQLANVTIMLTKVLTERDILREDNAALIAELATLKQPSA